MYFPEEEHTTTYDEYLGKKSDLNQIKPLDPTTGFRKYRRQEKFSVTLGMLMHSVRSSMWTG